MLCLPCRCLALLASLLLVFLYPALAQPWNNSGPVLDPCAPLTPVRTGDSFTLGLLLFPGYNATRLNEWIRNWNTLATALGETFNGYCTPNVTQELMNILPAELQPRFAVFSTRVDRLQLLQVPYSNIVLPMASVPASEPPTVAMVVFRGNIYSDAVYAASATPNLTAGNRPISQGGVGFAQTLSLMANFEDGNLRYLQWWGTNCDACGGAASNLCIKQPVDANVLTCVTALQNCTCQGIGVPSWACNYNNENFSQCNTGVQVSWTGTDSKSAAFRTGPQIERLNSLSIVSLFYTAFDYFSDLFTQTAAQFTATWGNITADSKSQRVDQASVLGR